MAKTKTLIEDMYESTRRERVKNFNETIQADEEDKNTKASLVEDRYTARKRERAEIKDRINREHINPDEEEQKMAKLITGKISDRFSEAMHDKSIEELSGKIRDAVKIECGKLERSGRMNYEQCLRIEKTVLMTILGNGPIEEFLSDPEVTEIVVQRYDNIVIEKQGKIISTQVRFNNEEHLEIIIKRIVQRCGRQINTTTPIVDARLADGSRVNAMIMPVSPDGATLTIRKFNNAVLSGDDYLEKGSLNVPMLEFLKACVRAKVSMFVSGGTGTGKTTLLNMLSGYIPDDELIITIEDTCELKLQQSNVRRREVRRSKTKEMMDVDQKALVKNALRERPDRIILGETRDGSVVDLISAMSTGHEGSMSTIHANSPKNMVDVRIPILYTMNEDANFSEKSIAMQIAEAIQVIVQITRFKDGSRKITSISYIDGVSPEGKVIVKDIFIFNRKKKEFEFAGNIPVHILQNFRNREVDFNDNLFNAAGG